MSKMVFEVKKIKNGFVIAIDDRTGPDWDYDGDDVEIFCETRDEAIKIIDDTLTKASK